MNDELESYLIAMDTSMAPGPSVTEAVSAPSPPRNAESLPVNSDALGMSPSRQEEDSGEEEDLGRPANKKVGA